MDTRSLEYNVVCVKWGNKFSPEHVNRLYRMAKKNITLPFNFYCYTENPDNLNPEIKVVYLDELLGLKDWWWKLVLFKSNDRPAGINLYLDLDVIIQNNIDDLFNIVVKDKLSIIDYTRIDSEVVSIFNPETEPYYNSSIMVWYNNDNPNLYETFIKTPKLFQKVYYGMDRFFSYEIPSCCFNPIDSRFYYFRTMEVKDESEYEYFELIRKNQMGSESIRLNYNPSRSICIFNGCHEEEFYINMESYFS